MSHRLAGTNHVYYSEYVAWWVSNLCFGFPKKANYAHSDGTKYTIKRNIASMIVTVVKELILTTFLIVEHLCFSTPVTRVSTFCIVYYVRNLLLFCKSPDAQPNL
jgi:hypothetical protein